MKHLVVSGEPPPHWDEQDIDLSLKWLGHRLWCLDQALAGVDLDKIETHHSNVRHWLGCARTSLGQVEPVPDRVLVFYAAKLFKQDPAASVRLNPRSKRK